MVDWNSGHNKFMVLLIVGVLTLAGLWSLKNISLFCDIRITGVSNGRLKIHALLYARIIVSSILNLAVALTACGTFAGSVIVSPDLTL